MNWNLWVQKLKQVKELIANTPDSLNQLADTIHKVELVIRQAADFLDGFGGGIMVGVPTELPILRAEFEALGKADQAVKNVSAAETVGMNPILQALIAGLVIKVIDRILDNRK